MRKGKFLLPGLFVVISLTFVVLWALADVISVSTSTEILGIWAMNINNSVAIAASHSWDVTCNSTVRVAYGYSHTIWGVGSQDSPSMHKYVNPPGDVHTETWTTYWWELQPGNYDACCATAAVAGDKSDGSSDTASFTVP